MLNNPRESCTMRVGMQRRERSHWVEVDREEFMNLVELKRQVNLNLNASGEEGKRQN